MFSSKRRHSLPVDSKTPSIFKGRPRDLKSHKDINNSVWHSLATRSKPDITGSVQPTIQTKLTIGTPDDKYEQEADRVADQVMRMPEPQEDEDLGIQRKVPSPTVQRICTGCEEELQRQTMEEEEEEPLQMKGESGSGSAAQQVSDTTASQIQSWHGGGEPLPSKPRASFEQRFGRDFEKVRIQRDAKAAGTAAKLHARAFTVGNNIAFGKGQFRPDTSEGERLLAHELTHVVQQTKGSQGGYYRQHKSTQSPDSQISHYSPPQVARQDTTPKDEAKTFTDLDPLWMKHMLRRFAEMDPENLIVLIKNVNKYSDLIHEERMLAALLAVLHKGKKTRREFEKSNHKLLSKVNPDQVALILDYLSMTKTLPTEINIYFHKVVKEEPGYDDEMYPIGHLNFYKKGKLAYSTKVSGGGHLGGLTDKVTGARIHRKEGGEHKSSNGGVAMPWPVYFRGLQAIHQGELDHASLSCVHVPSLNLMEKIHKDTRKRKTVVNVYYKKEVLDVLCPLREREVGKRNPCR